jgi:ATP adenylyltransferase
MDIFNQDPTADLCPEGDRSSRGYLDGSQLAGYVDQLSCGSIRQSSYPSGMSALTRRIVAPVGNRRSDCSFCSALSDDSAHMTEVPVLADDQFVAWVSHGALVEGHLLVIPRRHVLNLQQLDDFEKQSLPRFLGSVKALLTRHYGPICSFEHGPVRPGSPAGCSIDHAHLHLLPWRGSLVNAAESSYPSFSWRRTSDLSEALAFHSVCPYLFVQDDDGRASLAIDPKIPSQALRQTIAAAPGRREEWDWKAVNRLRTSGT